MTPTQTMTQQSSNTHLEVLVSAKMSMRLCADQYRKRLMDIRDRREHGDVALAQVKEDLLQGELNGINTALSIIDCYLT